MNPRSSRGGGALTVPKEEANMSDIGKKESEHLKTIREECAALTYHNLAYQNDANHKRLNTMENILENIQNQISKIRKLRGINP